MTFRQYLSEAKVQPVEAEVLQKAIEKTVKANYYTKELWQKHYNYWSWEEFQEHEPNINLRIEMKPGYHRMKVNFRSRMLLEAFRPYGGFSSWLSRYGWFISDGDGADEDEDRPIRSR